MNKIKAKCLYSDEIKAYFFMKDAKARIIEEQINIHSKLSIPIDYPSIEKNAEQSVIIELEHVLKHLSELGVEALDVLKTDHLVLYNKIIEVFKNVYINEEESIKKLKSCKRWHDFKKLMPVIFPPSLIDEIFAIGEDYYCREDFNRARILFSFLILISSKNPIFWLIKGLSEQNIERYDEALVSYHQAIQFDPTLFLTYLHIIECLLILSKTNEAMQVYGIFINEINKEDYENEEIVMLKLKKIEEKIAVLK